MEKLKWKYDPPRKEYYVWANGGEINFSIFKKDHGFLLERDDLNEVGTFKKLKNAKLCAQMIVEG